MMQIMYQVDMNFAFAFVMLMIAMVAFYRLNRRDQLSRAYLITAFVIVGQLIIEAFTVILDGNDDVSILFIRHLLSMSLFIIGPFLSLFWFFLLRKMLQPSAKQIKGFHLFIILPQVLNMIIVGLTPWTDFVFFIDSEAIYRRGDLFFVTMAFTYYYLILTFIMILNNRKSVVKEDLTLLLIATAIPVIGGVLQLLFYGVLFIWASVAVALILLYLFLQQRIIHHDYLTGTWSRESFFQYIDQKARNKTKTPCGAIYFDLDNLKQINDAYGHTKGDEALKVATEIVKHHVQPKGLVARLGGDEFIVISDVFELEALSELVMKIEQSLKKINKEQLLPFELSISIGYDAFNSTYDKFEAFINHIDQMMYLNKKNKHSTKNL